MEEQENRIIRAFDSTFTTNRIQMMKILFSHLSPSRQGAFAVYIKLMEMQYVFSLLQSPQGIRFPGSSAGLSSDFLSGDNEDTIELLDELLPFSNNDDRKKIEQMKNMMQSMKQMREMMDMIQMMREMFPEGMGSEGGMNPMDVFAGMNGGGMNPMDIFSNMGGMSGMPNGNDMSDLFNMFGGGNNDAS